MVDVAHKAFGEVYSVSQPLATVSERAHKLQSANSHLNEWLDSWMPECEWSTEPYGIVFKMSKSYIVGM
jgi:hypothetical protein